MARPAKLAKHDLILVHLMKVLAGYARCFPAICAAARFNPWQLLPQVCPKSVMHNQSLYAMIVCLLDGQSDLALHWVLDNIFLPAVC